MHGCALCSDLQRAGRSRAQVPRISWTRKKPMDALNRCCDILDVIDLNDYSEDQLTALTVVLEDLVGEHPSPTIRLSVVR